MADSSTGSNAPDITHSHFLSKDGLSYLWDKIVAKIDDRINSKRVCKTVMRKGTGTGNFTDTLQVTNPFGITTRRVIIRSIPALSGQPIDTLDLAFYQATVSGGTQANKTPFIGTRQEVANKSCTTYLVYGTAEVTSSALKITPKTLVVTPEFEFPFSNESVTDNTIVMGDTVPFLNINGVYTTFQFFKA